MNYRFKKLICVVLLSVCVQFCLAQNYPSIVTLESSNDRTATFTTIGVAEKKKDAEFNALQSLFYTLFHVGVDGVNAGEKLISKDNPSYVNNFLSNRVTTYASNRSFIKEPEKNIQKQYETTLRVTVPMTNLYKELTNNGVYIAPVDKTKLVDVDKMEHVVLPSIMVVPYKKDGESYDAILQSDYDRRIAVSKLQDGFESKNITTIDISAKIAAMKRRMEFEAGSAESNDKQLLLNSGAEVYVVVDLQKDIQPSGSRVSLIMKAYETASGSILASKDGFTRRFNTSALDMLCSYAVSDNVQPFLDDIVKNLNKQTTGSRRVVLQISIGGQSMATMSDQVGPNNYRLSDVIRQWVRKNSDMGKYKLQGIVDESMIFDYVMIPQKDQDGLMMDAAQYGFLLQSYLTEEQNIPCSSKIDGTTIYITID